MYVCIHIFIFLCVYIYIYIYIYTHIHIYIKWASQVELVVKNPPTSAGDTRAEGSIPGLGRFPGKGNSNPF